MARPRNNIAKLPWEIREIVCRMRFDCASNDAIEGAVREACVKSGIVAPKIHGTSLLAYEKSPEYTRYCDHRRQWDARMEPKRWAAAMLNDGGGPRSLADLAELEILEQLHSIAAGGLLETGKDVATVARAITTMQRTQLARRESEEDDRIKALEQEHDAEIAELAADAEAMQVELLRSASEVDRLAELCRKAGIDTSGTATGELSEAARARIRKLYGLDD